MQLIRATYRLRYSYDESAGAMTKRPELEVGIRGEGLIDATKLLVIQAGDRTFERAVLGSYAQGWYAQIDPLDGIALDATESAAVEIVDVRNKPPTLHRLADLADDRGRVRRTASFVDRRGDGSIVLSLGGWIDIAIGTPARLPDHAIAGTVVAVERREDTGGETLILISATHAGSRLFLARVAVNLELDTGGARG